MNRSEFQSAMGNCPFIPCECGGSADHLAIHAELTKAVERRVEQAEWDGIERRAEIIARAAHETERIRRAERAEVCAWSPSMTWSDRAFEKASDVVYTRPFLYALWAVNIAAVALFFFSLARR